MLERQDNINDLLARARRYMRETKIAPTTFGMQAVGTPNLMTRLESGRVTLSTYFKVSAFLAKYEGAKHLPKRKARSA